MSLIECSINMRGGQTGGIKGDINDKEIGCILVTRATSSVNVQKRARAQSPCEPVSAGQFLNGYCLHLRRPIDARLLLSNNLRLETRQSRSIIRQQVSQF